MTTTANPKALDTCEVGRRADRRYSPCEQPAAETMGGLRFCAEHAAALHTAQQRPLRERVAGTLATLAAEAEAAAAEQRREHEQRVTQHLLSAVLLLGFTPEPFAVQVEPPPNDDDEHDYTATVVLEGARWGYVYNRGECYPTLYGQCPTCALAVPSEPLHTAADIERILTTWEPNYSHRHYCQRQASKACAHCGTVHEASERCAGEPVRYTATEAEWRFLGALREMLRADGL